MELKSNANGLNHSLSVDKRKRMTISSGGTSLGAQ